MNLVSVELSSVEMHIPTQRMTYPSSGTSSIWIEAVLVNSSNSIENPTAPAFPPSSTVYEHRIPRSRSSWQILRSRSGVCFWIALSTKGAIRPDLLDGFAERHDKPCGGQFSETPCTQGANPHHEGLSAHSHQSILVRDSWWE